MRVYDNKGRLTVDFKLHASKHAKGGADEVSLAASQITSERFGMARMPDGTSGYFLKAQGAGVDPAYAVAIPSGLIAMWHGLIANIPSGWVICDGNNGTPNLLAKFVEGVATAATNPGATGGAASVTLTLGQIPAHTHTYSRTNKDHASVGSGDLQYGSTLSSVDSGSSGGGSAHENRPPFYDVAFIMKT
jgi:microcystin-dependent protein